MSDIDHLRFSRTKDDRNKHSISLVIEGGAHFFGLMVWSQAGRVRSRNDGQITSTSLA